MRVGVVGLGWAARSLHAPAIKALPEALLGGACDSSAEQRRRWEQATGTAAYESIDEMLASANVELAVVATPPESHAELCLRAIGAGADVFAEKPFVLDVGEADRVLDAAARAGRRVAVNHEFREQPIFKAVKARIDSGDVGRLVFCQIWQLMDLAPWDEPVAWRRAMSNRTLFEGGVHLVDLLLTMYGSPPEAVFARRSSGLSGHEADAIHLVTLEFPDGRLAQITIDRLCKAGTRYVELRADCEHGSLRASLGGRALLQLGKKRARRAGVRLDLGAGGLAWEERGLRRKVLARDPRGAAVRGTAELLRGVIEAVNEHREPPSSGREARAVLAVIDAAYRSAATGERIYLEAGIDV